MPKEERIDSIIGKNTIINGEVKVAGSTKIDGRIEGNISIKESLIVGRDSSIKGNVLCNSAIIGGKLEGNITAEEIIELQTGARLIGDISCRGLIVKEGVFFEGNCMMSQKAKDKEK